MNTPLRIFVGWDDREIEAYHVLCHSIIRRATVPVAIAPLAQPALRAHGLYWRDRGPTESTAFSLTRFLIPALCNYEGFAVFMDCDMLCRVDVAELYLYIAMHMTETARDRKSLLVCQHDYTPTEATKFLGHQQTVYPKKNWSSFAIFDASRCRALTPEYVNAASGLDLHRFNWLPEREVGALPLGWNHLIGERGYEDSSKAKFLHWTLGGPWLSEYEDAEHADEWRAERDTLFTPQGAGLGARSVSRSLI
jgi:hypothetical protein